jgi:hypothetical protein
MASTVNSEAMKDRTKQFALVVIRLCRTLPQNAEARIISRQLLRSATSVAAKLSGSLPGAIYSGFHLQTRLGA